jgi:antitoxin ParD1/3/4
MAHRETRTLSFTPQHSKFVTQCMESGRYQSASEVVRAALRMLEDAEARRAAELVRVRAMIAQGMDDIDRGDVVDAMTFLRGMGKRTVRKPRSGRAK